MQVNLLATPHGKKLRELLVKKNELVKKRKSKQYNNFVLGFSMAILVAAGITIFANSAKIFLGVACILSAIALSFVTVDILDYSEDIKKIKEEIEEEELALKQRAEELLKVSD